jgi:hypothetical protein
MFPPKRRFLQEPHGITSQKTPFFNWLTDGDEAVSLTRPPRLPTQKDVLLFISISGSAIPHSHSAAGMIRQINKFSVDI